MRNYIAIYVVAFDQLFIYVRDEIFRMEDIKQCSINIRRIPKDGPRNYELMKLNIMRELSDFNVVISNNFDLWTVSNQDIAYICAIAYYINFNCCVKKLFHLRH